VFNDPLYDIISLTLAKSWNSQRISIPFCHSLTNLQFSWSLSERNSAEDGGGGTNNLLHLQQRQLPARHISQRSDTNSLTVRYQYSTQNGWHATNGTTEPDRGHVLFLESRDVSSQGGRGKGDSRDRSKSQTEVALPKQAAQLVPALLDLIYDDKLDSNSLSHLLYGTELLGHAMDVAAQNSRVLESENSGWFMIPPRLLPHVSRRKPQTPVYSSRKLGLEGDAGKDVNQDPDFELFSTAIVAFPGAGKRIAFLQLETLT